ncbi:MAG: nuclease A inhibitor family protein [Saprospiraceae bacterium]|nr:nuclease A inhibitor family protein [Saprospiraceae bacterium]
MARLSKQHVYAALDRAAKNILDARGDDPFVSRKDIRLKLNTLSGVEQQLTSIFYRFMDHRDHKPGARITEADVTDTLAYAKEKLIDKYDVNNNGLSKAEIAEMSLTARLAVRLARMMQEDQAASDDQSTAKILEGLKALGEGLYFPAWANEADAFLQVFHQEAELDSLTRESFRDALGLSLVDRAEAVYFFQQGVEELAWIFENYEDFEAEADQEKFQTLLDFMIANLRDITHIIVGEDGLRSDSEYPVYLVGLTPDGDIAGFETTTVWT